MALFILIAAYDVAYVTGTPRVWVIMVGFSFFISSFAIGVGGTGWLIQGEVFPTAVRGRAAAACASVDWLANFVIVQWFPTLQTAWGLAWVMVLFAFLAVLAIAFVAASYPQPRGSRSGRSLRFLRRGPKSHRSDLDLYQAVTLVRDPRPSGEREVVPGEHRSCRLRHAGVRSSSSRPPAEGRREGIARAHHIVAASSETGEKQQEGLIDDHCGAAQPGNTHHPARRSPRRVRRRGRLGRRVRPTADPPNSGCGLGKDFDRARRSLPPFPNQSRPAGPRRGA
jgi:hypothetical protein